MAMLLAHVGVPARVQIAASAQSPAARPGGPSPGRRALLVGAWDYAPGVATDFPPLRSEGRSPGPVEDVKALKSVLTSRLGFGEGDVKVLTTKQETTRGAIVEAFRAFLIRQTNEGDLVYFHYSGHGSQLPDDDVFGPKKSLANKNLSADEPDGLDETLVPTDYGPNGENEIRDDELNQLVRELVTTKRPASVVLTFDSCYSGTVVRGGALARGRGWSQREAWPGEKPEPRARRKGGPRGDGLLDPGAAVTLDFVSMSAARDRERAWQVFDGDRRLEMGRFTSALVTALAEADSETTYEDLFARVRGVMANLYADQHPQLEGRGGRLVFDGAAREPQRFTPVRSGPGGALVLGAGRLHGVTKGSVFALFPPEAGDIESAKPLARAAVDEVRLDESGLRLVTDGAPDPAGAKLPPFMKGREIEHSYGQESLRLLVERVERLARGAEVARLVGTVPGVEVLNAAGVGWDVRLRAAAAGAEGAKESGGTAFILERQDGSLIERVADAPGAGEAVVRALRREARWRYAKSLENRNPLSSVKVKMRVVRVEAEGRCDEDDGFEYVRDRGEEPNQPALNVCDIVAVDVMNLGGADAYVTLFDLASDGELTQLWPDAREPITDNFISGEEKGKWVRLWDGSRSQPYLFKIMPPLGRDVFKIISTTGNVSFKTLLTRAAQTPFERMMRNFMNGGGVGSLNTAEDWYTDSVVFETLKR